LTPRTTIRGHPRRASAPGGNTTLSLVQDPVLTYPAGEGPYSPDEPFPEYRLGHLSSVPNPVYAAVRRCFAQAGLDAANFGTRDWNPLRTLVPRGGTVFVLCNFVLNRRPRETAEGFAAKCLHGSVLRAVVDYLLLAIGDEGRLAFGNSPMQHTDWEAVLRETGAEGVLDFYHSKAIPVEAKDLRLFVVRRNRSGAIVNVERRSDDGGTAVDLGRDSFFAGMGPTSEAKYRVMNYGDARMRVTHGDGRHAYVINRAILDADVVFSLPKLKTHEKAGITCVMKNCVGTVGHKDSLPHHRFGSPGVGGDEYPADRTGILRTASAFHDRAQRTVPGSTVGNVARVADRAVRVATGLRAPVREGAWSGNDTAWRMVVDLARIVTHSDRTGQLQDEPSRQHLALVDGIIGGEGQGPLTPTPVRSGLLLLADNPLLADYACALMMGFDPRRLPSVSRALEPMRFGLFQGDVTTERAVYNGRSIALPELAELAKHHFAPPLGWEGVI
jgi:hypothetical protein